MVASSTTKFAAIILAIAGVRGNASEPIDFARDVRPILSDACFHCHGPDEDTRQADLRLDTRGGLMTDFGDDAVVKPGSPDESELLRRIDSVDSDERMPPPDSNKTLTAEQRKTLREWIEQGANWQEHWAFEKPMRPQIPAMDDPWGRNEIDAFVLRRLQEADLRPSKEAPTQTLVRRIFLDLTGLLPTPEESDQWVDRIWGDNQVVDEPQYVALVDSLMSSPRYGERWARKWLDLARYADTNGYEKDRDRTVWPYRDWVIDAINHDKPFDEFTVEQIAGDMLPNATEEQVVATGFHRNTMLNEEGGIDPLEFRYHAMTDRVATTGTTWLGLTLGCCQCHTHKYDPVSHTEYFGILALLNNADEPMLELARDDVQAVWDVQNSQAREKLDDLRRKWHPPKSPEAEVDSAVTSNQPAAEVPGDNEAQFEAAFAAWLGQEQAGVADWKHLRPTKASASLPILTVEADDSVFASGDTAKRDDYWLEFGGSDVPIKSLQLEALADERLPAGGPGSTYYEGTLGDFFLTEFRILLDGKPITIASATASYAKNRFGSNPATAEQSIDGDIQTGWAVHDAQAQDHVAVYRLEKPIPAGQPFKIHMSFGRHFASSLGRFRVSSNSGDSNEPLARSYPASVQAALRANGQLSPQQKQLLEDEFLLADPQFSSEAPAIRKLLVRPRSTTTLVMRERPANQTRKTFRHHRGEYLQPREQVSPGLPGILTRQSHATDGPPVPSNRLEFAQWLASEDNVLVARVVVNRQWAALMGRGLVKTVDDFGLQGSPPTHPGLLDWLAVEFMQQDEWSVKALHRRIVCSSVYRQSSSVQPAALTKDPGNTLYWRASRPRLEAEVIRDSMLAASGDLVEQLGGPPVKPPQPSGVTEVAYGSPKWNASTGGGRYRRSIYTKVKRTAPFAMFSTFDAPSGEACIARRVESNSPLQALTLLNDPMVTELADHLAVDLLRDVTTTGSIDLAEKADLTSLARMTFRRILVREPSEVELESTSSFLDTQYSRLIAAGTRDAAPVKTQRKAVSALARALLALDETQTRN